MRYLIVILLLVALSTAFGARVYFLYRPSGFWSWGVDWEGFLTLFSTEGHSVTRDSLFINLDGYDIFFAFFRDTVIHREVEKIQDFVGRGGKAILIGEWGPDPGFNPYLNGVLADSIWDDSLGNIRNNDDIIWDPTWTYPPWDTLHELGYKQTFPNFDTSSGFFSHVDTILTSGPSSFSILSPDSGTAKPLIWGVEEAYSIWGPYVSYPVVAIRAEYGLGTLILFGDVLNTFELLTDTVIYCLDLADNRQFIRNLFTTNDRADSVWLTGTDSSFTIFLPGSTPFVAGSTSFSFESAAYGLWGLR
ncbi:hypothetical protein J7L01_02940, partial [bacterium]|nr:hypothetical protein [bacterium]